MEKQNNQTEKLTEHTFSRLLLSSVLGILLCITCLCSTTFAWFTGSTSSTDNVIKTAEDCLLTVTVTDSGSELADIENGVLLKAGVSYTVTLTLPSDTASGYCLIETEDATYRTGYIRRHEEAQAKTLSFTLTVAEDMTVSFITRWGIYSGECDVRDGALHIQ